MNSLPPGDEPGRDLDAEALSRVLDGLELDDDADDAERSAQTRAEDDVAKLMRAFALMGDTLAGPVDEPVGAVVLPFSARLRRRAPILLAAASLIGIVGLGTVVVNNDLGGSESDSSTAAQAPADSAAGAIAASEAPASTNGLLSGRDEAGRAAALKAGASAADAPTAESAAEADAVDPAPASSTKSSSTSKKAPKSDTKTESANSALDTAVACNRGVLIGKVVSIESAGARYTLRVLVSDWISPGSGPVLAAFTIGKNYVLTDDGRTDLKAGQEWLFVVPESQSSAVRAFPGPDYGDARDQVTAAQNRTAGNDC